MKCFIGIIEKKLEGNTLFYREPVQIDKNWSIIFSYFFVRVISRAAEFYSL